MWTPIDSTPLGEPHPAPCVQGPMKMATWRHLVRATSDRITDNERRIERQRQLIADLARDDEDTTLSERELAVLIQSNEKLKESKAWLLESMPGHCAHKAHTAVSSCSTTSISA